MQVSVWEKESFYAHKDVLIIGSGLVGLWSAWHLKKKHPKWTIAIADRHPIPTGASTRNAGFACFGSLTELLHDIHTMGKEKTLELVAMRYEGLQKIQQVFKRKTIDFETCGGYELIDAKSNPGLTILQQQIEQVNEWLRPVVDKKNTFKLADKKIRSFGFANIQHLIENKPEGYLHSGKLCQALLQAVQALGVTVLSATEITGFEKTTDHFTLHTPAALPLTASQLLVCTNAFARQLLPALDVVPARGQVLVTAPVEGLAFKGTFHYDEGYYYFRNLGNRVLLGGARNHAFEEETTTNMTTTDIIQQQLEHFLTHYLLPGQPVTITDRWSGIMAMGSEKMPIVQEVQPQVFCAVRMSGMGVALAPVVGEQMARMM